MEEEINNQTEYDINNDLDISWTQPYAKEIHIYEQLHREPMNEINTIFIYVDQKSVVTRVISKPHIIDVIPDKRDGDDKKRGIPNAKVLQLVQEGKIFEMKKYKLLDILLYCVNIDPENIQKYINDECNYLKVLNIFNDIIIPDTIFIFHKINTLYFVFKEKENIGTPLPKSILKVHSKTKKKDTDNDTTHVPKIYTKKVSFIEMNESNRADKLKHNTNITRKNKINIAPDVHSHS